MPDVGAPKNDIGYAQILDSAPETSTNYDTSAMYGDVLYEIYGDSAVVFNGETGYVRFYGNDYYTSLVTKGDWLHRKYGDSIIVRDNNGIAYARYDGNDWYVPSLPRIDVTTEQARKQDSSYIVKLDGSSMQGVTLPIDNTSSDITGVYLSDNFPGNLTQPSTPQTKSFDWNNPNFQVVVQGKSSIRDGELHVDISDNVTAPRWNAYDQWLKNFMEYNSNSISDWLDKASTFSDALMTVPNPGAFGVGGLLKGGTAGAKGLVNVVKSLSRAEKAVDFVPGVSKAAEEIGAVSKEAGNVVGKTYNVNGKVLTETEFANLRKKAIYQAWQQERELVETTGRGTREWTEAEKQELLSTGKVKGYEGQHMKSAEAYPNNAGDPNNIQFLKGRRDLNVDEHLDAHGGNYKNPTNGYYDPQTGKFIEFGDYVPGP